MKEKITKIVEALGGIKTSTWVTLVTILIAITNMVLTSFGKNPIGVSEDVLYQYVSWVLTFGSVIFGLWKNISVTKNAQTADEVLALIKQGLITADEVKEYIKSVKK